MKKIFRCVFDTFREGSFRVWRSITFTHIWSVIHAHAHILVSLTHPSSLLLIYSSSRSFVIHTHTHTQTGLISLPPFHPLVEPYNIRDYPVANDFMTLWCHRTSAFTNYIHNDPFVSEENLTGPPKLPTDILLTSLSLPRSFPFSLSLSLSLSAFFLILTSSSEVESMCANFINLFM